MNQESSGELDIFRRPLQSNDFVRTPREDDPDQPLRWVDMGTLATNVVAIRQDGRQAVVRTATQTIVYDLVDRKHLHEWNEVFRQAKFTSDGKLLATIGANKLSLWDTQTFQFKAFPSRVEVLGKPRSRQDPRFSQDSIVAIDPKSEQIVVSNRLQVFDASLPAGLLIYSTRDGRFKRSIEFSFEFTPNALQFLLDGKRILCSYSKGNHHSIDWHAVFDTTTGRELATFNSDDLRIAVSPDGLSFATAKCAARVSLAGPTTLKVYDAETLRVKRVFDYPLTARQFTFSPDSRRILVAYGDPGKSSAQLEQSGHLIEWDIDGGRKSFSSINEHKTFASVAYSPSGNRRFATTEAPSGIDDDVSRWLHGWETDSGQALKIEPYEVNYNGQERLIFFPHGEVFVDAESDEPFAVKNVLNGEAVLTLPNYRSDARDAEFMAGDDKFIVSSDLFGGSVIADVSSGRQRRWLAKRRPSFFNAGRNLFSQYPLEIADVLSGKSQWRLTLNGLATISHDGKWIVVASDARIVLIEVSRPFQPRTVSVGASALAFHPDSQRFLAASANGVEEYEVASGKRLRTLWNPPGRTTDMTYSNDGKSVLSCGVLGHQEHTQPVDATDEGWAAIVQASSGNNVDLIGHSAPVTCVAFSETAELVATGSMDHTVRVWNSAGKLLTTFSAHRAPISDVTFNSGTSLLLSTARDGAALWDVSSITEPVRPSPSVADSFQVVENLVHPHGHPIEADLTKEGFFEGSSTIRKLGPTAEIEVQKEHWNLIRVGRLKDSNSGNKAHLRWLDLASSETRIIVNAKELKNSGFPNRPQNYSLLDTSFDRSQAVFASGKEQKIEVMSENGELVQRFTFPKSPQNSPSIDARLSRSKKTLIVESTLGDGKQLDVYDVATATHKYTLGGFHSIFSTCFHIDPLERTLLVKTTETARPNALVLYALEDGRQIATQEVLGHVLEHANAGYSTAGHFIIERPLERTEVKLVNPLTLDTIRTFKCDSPVLFAQTTHDDKRLFVGQAYVNETYLMSCWDVESGEPLWSKVGSAGLDGIFSPAGKYYLCGNRNVWTLWEMESGEVQCVLSFDIETQCLPQEGAIFSSLGDALFLGSVDGPLLWSERK